MSFKEGCDPFTECDFTVYEDYKINLEFILTASIINFKTQDFTSSFVYCHVMIHYYGFPETIPSQLSNCILHELLIMHSH